MKNARAGNEGADYIEIRVLGRGSHECDKSFFDMREQRVLLGPVPAVDLIHE